VTQQHTDIEPDPLAVDSHELLVAVDLGSNSFQLLIASYSQGQLKVIDRLREMVRLAAGLDENQHLDAASQERALACLARFGERLRDIPPERLRAVGTNTLRKAHNPAGFLEAAQDALGHEIDIISGVEEARLIYVGVSRTLPAIEGDQLFIDIGGGSTELAAGKGFRPTMLESLHMGCVSMSRNYFPDGKISARRFARARTAARLELRPFTERFRRIAWERAAGASGTIRAAAAVAVDMGLTEQNITVNALRQLIDHMIEQGHVDKLGFSAMSAERVPVFPGGIAILIEVLQALRIEELAVAQGALREGILYDLIGRSTEEDSRTLTVRTMEKRYHVDGEQADRVEQTAVALFDQVAEDWKLNKPGLRQLLAWAARLHEIGLDIAHAHYHRHGAYLLEHSDMPGFDRNEQKMLASLVEGHRRKLVIDERAVAGKSWAKCGPRLAMLLRFAALFNRNRTDELPDLLQLTARGRTISLSLSADWLEANPLTSADIASEQNQLQAAGYELVIETAAAG
jgi:exopolyphosphatase/guanosine-5'-triphosphate,3'-diphosphate pyrophosphatase